MSRPTLKGIAPCFIVRNTAAAVAFYRDALAAEFGSRGVGFSVPLEDTRDGLHGFELKDPDGYVLFFG